MSASYTRLLSCIAVVAVAGVAAAPASAQSTQTSNIVASATVTTVCSVSAGALSFGEISVSGATQATTSITANCTNGGAYAVSLSDGANADVGQRRLAATGGHYLNYDLFQEAGHTTRWGATADTDVEGTGSGSAQSLTVYGQVPAGQTLNSGAGRLDYSDSVQVTITY